MRKRPSILIRRIEEMTDNVSYVYLAAIEDVIRNVQGDPSCNFTNNQLKLLKEMWASRTLNSSRIQKPSKLLPLFSSDDMEYLPIKVTIPKKFRRNVYIDKLIIDMPKFIVRRNLVKTVLPKVVLSNIIYLPRNVAQVVAYKYVAEMATKIKKQVEEQYCAKCSYDWEQTDSNISISDEELLNAILEENGIAIPVSSVPIKRTKKHESL